MSDSSDGLRKDALVIMAIYVGIYIYSVIKDGFSRTMTISLALNAVLLGGIIYYSDKNEKVTGVLGLIFSVLLFLGGGIIGLILAIGMGIRSIKCLMS